MTMIVPLQAGLAQAHLVPAAGGRVASLQLQAADGHLVDVLHPYDADLIDPVRWGKGGIYPLLPYSNRIARACLSVSGEQVRLEPHPDAAPHSLHGPAHLLPWTLEQRETDRAVMVLDALPSRAWPWHYAGRMELALTANSLRIHIALRNLDLLAMPAGIGLHPYIRHAVQARLAYGASARWLATPDFLATGSRALTPDERYQPARVLPAGGVTHYAGGWNGCAEVEVPLHARLRIEADPVFGHLVVHRPDSLAYLCLEPVSHVADGFNLAERGVPDTGTHWLAPGETLSGEVRFNLLNP